MPVSAPMPSDPAAELRELRARLLRVSERATAALEAGLPGYQPGEALRQFLAAEVEVAASVRRIKKLQASSEHG